MRYRPSGAEHLVTAWLEQAAEAIKARDKVRCGPIGSNPADLEIVRKLDAKFDLLARALGEHIVPVLQPCLQHQRQENVCDAFLKAARPFLTAQINSRDQKLLDPAHDWGWYFAEVFDEELLGLRYRRTSNIWCRDGAGIERRRKLDRALLTLNSGYCHWQLLDDLADLKSDTEQGLSTAPGTILLSQGTMARLFLEYVDQGGGFSDAVARQFVEAVRDSRLLCDWFLSSSLCDRYRHSIATIPGDNSPSAKSVSATILCACQRRGQPRRCACGSVLGP